MNNYKHFRFQINITLPIAVIYLTVCFTLMVITGVTLLVMQIT